MPVLGVGVLLLLLHFATAALAGMLADRDPFLLVCICAAAWLEPCSFDACFGTTVI